MSRVLTGFLASCVVFSLLLPMARAEEKTAQELQEKLHAALKVANPDYQGGGTFRVKEGRLVAIILMRCPGLTDLSPLRQFDLSAVTMVSLYKASNVTDLSPLQGCRLKSLNLERCDKISDLSPLKGMPLQWFRMYACPRIEDLSPLQEMPLEHLDIGLNPRIRDLQPLQQMPLHDLRFDNCPQIKDISLIQKMPLKFLSLFGCPGIEDYSPLGGLQLETLYFTPSLLSKDEIALLRQMKTLQRFGTSWNDYRKEAAPMQFWERYDAGEFKTPSKR